MDINHYFGLLGYSLVVFSFAFLLVCCIAERRLLKKWKAEENKWVKSALTRVNVINFYYLIKENAPPKEFEEEFENSFKKRYFWIGYSLCVFGFLVLATSIFLS